MSRPQPTTIDLAPRFVLLVALLGLLVAPSVARAFDPAAPAEVHVLVRDDDGKPLPGVEVRLSGPVDLYGERPTSHAVTDAAGTAALDAVCPAARRDPVWDAEVEFSKPEYICEMQHVRLFPGALMDKEWTLRKECKTLIRLRGPNDEPLSGTRFYLAAEGLMDMGARTDARGEYLCLHPPAPGGIGVGFQWGEWPYYEDAPTVTIRYAASELPGTLPPRQIELRVLADDGKPAAGWCLIPDAIRTGGGGIGGSEPILSYRCRSLQRLDPHGTANLLLVNDLVFVVSPAGAVFRFRLNPAAWPSPDEKIHRLSLTIPPLRERHAGRLVWQDGQPIGGVPLVVQHTGRIDTSWQDPARSGQFNVSPLWRAVADDSTHIELVRTDADGRYELPFYFGGQSQFGLLTHDYWPEGLDSRPQVILKRPPKDLDDFRDMLIVFRDEQVRPVDNVRMSALKTFHGKQGIGNFGGDCTISDRRGRHLFLPTKVDRIELETTSAFWQPHREELAIPPRDAQLEIVLAETTRRSVLSGVVLDPDGQPVPRVTVSKLHPAADRQRYGTPFAGGRTKTDARGRFSFDQPPQQLEPTEGHLALSRPGHYSKEDPLPGWIDEVPFSADSHDLTIRLKRGGTVRVLLREGDRTKYRVSIGGLPPLDGPLNYHRLQYDLATHSMLATQLRPGRYQLWVQRANREDQAEEEDDARRAPVDLVEGRETTIDLRQEKFPDRAPRPSLPIAVAVEQDGHPVKGAQVFVYSLPRFDERLPADLASDRAEVRKQAIQVFEKGGIAAIAPLGKLLSSDDADLRTSARSIEKAFEQYFNDGLKEAGADISDDGGRAWFLAFSGLRYIAVARMPGRSIGFRIFAAEQGTTPQVEMQRSRALRVRVALEKNGYAALNLRLPGAAVEQAAALFHVCREPLTYASASYHGRQLVLPVRAISEDFSDGQMTYLVEDLPIGTQCELQLTGLGEQSLQKTVTIDDQPAAVQTIELTLPAPPNP